MNFRKFDVNNTKLNHMKLIFRLPLRMEPVLLMPFLVHRRGGRCLLVLGQRFIKVK
jgi:hypothetical protein